MTRPLFSTTSGRIRFAGRLARWLPRGTPASTLAANACCLMRETGCTPEFAARNALASARALILLSQERPA